MTRTIQDVFDTLSETQKKRVYYILGSIVEGNVVDPDIVDLSFLSNIVQIAVVKELIKYADNEYCKKKIKKK